MGDRDGHLADLGVEQKGSRRIPCDLPEGPFLYSERASIEIALAVVVAGADQPDTIVQVFQVHLLWALSEKPPVVLRRPRAALLGEPSDEPR